MPLDDFDFSFLTPRPITFFFVINHLCQPGLLHLNYNSSKLVWMLIYVGEQPTELLAENCAINSFDINRQNPSVCASYNLEVLGYIYFFRSSL